MATYVKELHSCGNEADDLVVDRFDRTATIADNTLDLTKGYLDSLYQFLESLEVPSTSEIDVDMPEVPDISFIDRPSLTPGDYELDLGDLPSAPTLSEVDDISEVDIPVFSITPPAYENPEKPSESEITEPGDVPIYVSPDIPAAPDTSLPDAPVLADIVLPAAPEITIPVFDDYLEPIEIPAANGFQWEESPYNSDVWNSLLDKVLNGIVNGETGLGSDVEQAIFDAARIRQAAVNDKMFRDIETDFAARGFEFPPGALAARLAEAAAEITRNDTELNYKIMIEQAELALKNTQFMVDKGVQLEEILRQFFENHEKRMFEAAVQVHQSSLAIYNAQVARYNLVLEQYKARSVAYKAQVDAALAQVEIFKAQVESARVSAEVQRLLVSTYEIQVKAVSTVIELYNSQLNSAKILADLERLKFDAYKTETSAYLARLEGEKVKYDVYEAELKAESTKAQVYSEQVKAYAVEVEAVNSKIKAETAVVEAQIKTNDSLIEAYKAELAGYDAQLKASVSQIQARSTGFTAEVQAYTAETGALAQYYAVKSQEIDTAIKEAEFELRKAIAEVDAATKGYVSINEIRGKGMEGIANIGSQLTAAALNAVNASAQLSESSTCSIGNNLSETYNSSMGL